MTRLPDISDYFTPQLALQEEVHWILERAWRKPLDFIAPRLADHGVKKIVEFGCRSGLLAAKLPFGMDYTGIDTNTWLLDRARQVNFCIAMRRFQCWDCRNWNKPREADTLAMAWGVLKHYSLEEWDKILINLLNACQYAAFNVQIVEDEPFDNGEHFHHTFVTEARIENVLRAAGHKIESREVLAEWEVDGKKARDVAYWTKYDKTGEEWKMAREVLVDLAKKGPGEEVHSTGRFVTNETLEKKLVGIMGTLCGGLLVNNEIAKDLHRFAIRFVETDTGHEPVLYMDGRRVPQAWHLKLDWRQEADPHGDNANTAERER